MDALLKRTTTTNRDVEMAKLVATRDLVNSPETEAHGFGYNSPAAWQAAQALMLEFGGLTKKADKIDEYYSNEFLPKNTK